MIGTSCAQVVATFLQSRRWAGYRDRPAARPAAGRRAIGNSRQPSGAQRGAGQGSGANPATAGVTWFSLPLSKTIAGKEHTTFLSS